MRHTSIRSTLQRRPLGAQALACVLVLALVWAPSLGLWHSVVHGDASHGGRADAVAQMAAQEPGQAPSLLQRLFAGHQYDADCQFFDQHSHGDALTGVAPALAVQALPAAVLAASHALAVARWHALFQARGPPSVR
jgi:hypothetical protein